MHLFRGLKIDGTIDADDSAKGRDRITFQSTLKCFSQSLSRAGAAGVGVLDDGANWLVEFVLVKFLGEIPCGLKVDDVVEGKLLALKLAGIGHSGGGAIGIHGGFLMRVFAVAQILSFVE